MAQRKKETLSKITSENKTKKIPTFDMEEDIQYLAPYLV